MTATGHRLNEINLNDSNLSEILRVFVKCRGGKDDPVSLTALNFTQMDFKFLISKYRIFHLCRYRWVIGWRIDPSNAWPLPKRLPWLLLCAMSSFAIRMSWGEGHCALEVPLYLCNYLHDSQWLLLALQWDWVQHWHYQQHAAWQMGDRRQTQAVRLLPVFVVLHLRYTCCIHESGLV